MDDKTKTMMLTLAAGVIKKGLITLGTTAATHGVIAGNQVETFVSVGMVLVGLGWSLWNDYGKAIVLSQLEVLKAKSLAQAASMKSAGVPPVTTSQIAAQSPTLTPTEVAKTVETLPPAIQATIVKVLLVAFALSFLLAVPSAQAQTALRKPQVTGNIVEDTRANLGIGRPGSGLTGSPLNDLIGALDKKLLPDLEYAKKLADASGSKVTGPCFAAWIDIINTRQKAVQDAQGQDLPLPEPHLVTDFEKLVELRNSLQPDSEFMIKCSPVASMVKKDIIGFIGTVISGGAGLATLVPGL